MKISTKQFLAIPALFIFIFSISASAQTAEVVRAQAQVNEVLADASKHFRDGMTAFSQSRRTDAGEKFDDAVEVFLSSTLNIQNNPQLQTCYTQLIETVYRLEFPAGNQPPQLKPLSASCGWKWSETDFLIADKVIAMAGTADPKRLDAKGGTGTAESAGPAVETYSGFDSQEFTPAVGDELARVELTPDELEIEGNPEAQAQYQNIQYAVANQSLGFSFQVHPMIQQYINYYRGRGRKTMEVGLYRSGMFMSMARRIFREEGIPENVAWLGQVESAWKPTAMSWAAASGLWQFIPATGARYGLRRTAYVDERNSFEKATRASARYLKFLFNRYQNWELAMAGYNCGEGNVDRAIRRAGVKNFWAAYPYLPRETRNYVPNILATILVANNPQHYGFGHVRPAAPLRYDRIRVPPSTNLTLIAQSADTTVQYIRYLNPHLRTNSTPPEPYIVNIPAGKSDDVVAVFKRIPASRINTTKLARSVQGETWQTISNRTGVSVGDLMAANPGMDEPKGKVFVPMGQTPGNRVTATSYSRPRAAPIASNVKIVKAQSGDTVSKLAVRHGADPVEVAKYNGLLVNSVLGSGREIKIPSK